MAGSADPGYNSNMQRLPIPDSDVGEVQPVPMIDWASPIPGPPVGLVDALIGDSTPPGQPFTRRVTSTGQSDVSDPGA